MKRGQAIRKPRLKTGDQVIVLSGRDKGKKGEIIEMRPRQGRVVVRGVNMVKRHQRPSATSPGGIVDVEAPLHLSNVALLDPKTGEPTRVGYKFKDDGKKVRVAKRSGEVIDG